jgi:hypothetical protein
MVSLTFPVPAGRKDWIINGKSRICQFASIGSFHVDDAGRCDLQSPGSSMDTHTTSDEGQERLASSTI